jgi:hypothetical protein
MAEHMKISKCNKAHKWSQGQKSHDHLNRCRKCLDKNQQPFMIKALKNLGVEGMYLNLIKVIYNKPTANLILSEKAENISSKVRNEKRVSPVSSYSKSLSKAMNQKKEIKGIWMEKEEITLFLFA